VALNDRFEGRLIALNRKPPPKVGIGLIE